MYLYLLSDRNKVNISDFKFEGQELDKFAFKLPESNPISR